MARQSIQIILFLTVAFPLAASCSPTQSAVQTQARASKGREIYTQNCMTCHGETGDGNGRAAPAISGAKPRDFTQGKFKYGIQPEKLFATITDGVSGTAMPPWKHLSVEDRWAVIEYIRQFQKK